MTNIKREIESFIDQVKVLRVCVIGETIIDEFIEVEYEGQSMKSFCPVFRYTNLENGRERQRGGAAAVARHLEDFVAKVDLVTNGDEEIVKTRLIDVDDKKKHVEINRIDNRNFGEISINADDYDVVIVADFGHGFCDKLNVNGKFHYMTQTNSNNFGYNRMSKWKKNEKISACLDLREASLQVNSKTDFSERTAIHELFNYELSADILYLTLGMGGAVYYDGKNYIHQPVFKGPVVDTIGAGDTFYGFASLAAHINFENMENIMLIPALAASLSCTWLCNQNAVTKEKLYDHADRFI